jgi:hypothetical protein
MADTSRHAQAPPRLFLTGRFRSVSVSQYLLPATVYIGLDQGRASFCCCTFVRPARYRNSQVVMFGHPFSASSVLPLFECSYTCLGFLPCTRSSTGTNSCSSYRMRSRFSANSIVSGSTREGLPWKLVFSLSIGVSSSPFTCAARNLCIL